MENILTIAIPTYNRQEKLLRVLNKIHAIKKTYKINVLIIDNASSPSVELYLRENNFVGFDYTRINRNEANIGIGANILLAHIQAKTEWTWVLGDDDLPLDNCFEIIFNAITNVNRNDFLIKFNTAAGSWPTADLIIQNELDFAEFCKDIRYYSNMLFISNSVFRTANMQKYAHQMMNFSQTMNAWLIGYLENLANGQRILIKKEYIIQHGIATKSETWSYHKLKEGILFYSDLDGHTIFKKIAIRNLILTYFNAEKHFGLSFFVYCFRYNEYSVLYWKWFYRKCGSNFKGFKKLQLLLIANTIGIYYNLLKNNKFINKRIKKSEKIINDRN